MTDTTQVTKPESGQVRAPSYDEPAVRPAVDIFEDKTGITLRADMPGVSRDTLDVRVDRDTLTIEGQAELGTPNDMEALYADIQSDRYRTSFTLSGELDSDNIEANLAHGVLTLRIHKRAEHRPRKIEVQGI
jgi:HSP20 family molecular chaperone IbpA